MKKAIYTLIFYVFVHTVSAQVKTIKYDFDTKGLPTPLNKIKVGDFYQIQILNINQNLYKVSINSADTSSSKPQTTPTFGSLELDVLAKVIAGISPLNTTTLVNPNINSFTKSQPIGKAKFKFDLNDQIKICNVIRNTVDVDVKQIDDFKLKVYKERLNALQLSNTTNSLDFAQALKTIENIRKELKNAQKMAEESRNLYEKFSTDNKKTIDDDPDLTAKDREIKDSYDKSITTLTEAFASVSADKVNELLSMLVLLENNKDNVYTSLPFQFMGEQAKVTISIVPRSDTYNLSSYSTQLIFPSRLKPYTVVGLSFYGTTLRDDAYSTVETPTSANSSVFSIKQEEDNKVELGIAALLRVGTKFSTNSNFGVHVSFGPGVSITTKIKPRLLLGGGFSYGKKHMIALDIGGIAGYVDRKSVTVDVSAQYAKKPDPVVVSKIGIGGFASLGYMYQF